MSVQWLVSGAALLPRVRAGRPQRQLGVITERSASACAKHLNPGAVARLLALLKLGASVKPVGVRVFVSQAGPASATQMANAMCMDDWTLPQ
jgi:hypothetical protein